MAEWVRCSNVFVKDLNTRAETIFLLTDYPDIFRECKSITAVSGIFQVLRQELEPTSVFVTAIIENGYSGILPIKLLNKKQG